MGSKFIMCREREKEWGGLLSKGGPWKEDCAFGIRKQQITTKTRNKIAISDARRKLTCLER
jgi:hypothetical protein